MKSTTLDMELEILKTKDLQEILGIGRDKAYALMKSDAFPSVKLGKRYIISKADLIAWIDTYKYSAYQI